MSPEYILQHSFGLKKIKKEQEEIISWTMEGGHCLVVMPTGWGKSLCYQVPALMSEDGLTLVVSPLIALMKDQVDKLTQKQISAAALHSALSKEKKESVLNNIRKNKYRLLYVTPERFQKKDFMRSIKQRKVSLMAVDEAHCISQWGHDFRPDYSRLGEVRKKLGNPVTMALTATASMNTQKDILKNLNLSEDTRIFKKSVYRPNLRFSVQNIVGMDNKILAVQNSINKHQPAIVYFSLIHTLEEVAQHMQSSNIPFVKYHGQLSPQLRHQNQSAFLKGSVPIMMATPAFGLGVDKKNVRLIVHFEIPLSLESYYQSAGRAGRDNKPALCRLLYDEDDLGIGMEFIKWSNPSLSFIQQVFQILQKQEKGDCPMGLDYIREQLNFYNRRDFRVETAVNLLKRWNYLIEEKGEFRVLKDSGTWPDAKLLEEKRKHQLVHLKKMMEYAKNSECRNKIITEYFGEPGIVNCNNCDNCLTH